MDRIIFWDFDGTLGYRPENWPGTLMAVLNALIPDHPITVEQVRPFLREGFPWHTADVPHPELADPNRWWGNLEPVFARADEGAGCPRSLAQEAASRARHRYVDSATFTLFDDTLPTLRTLSDLGFLHRLITNHVPELSRVLNALGLQPLIEQVTNSAEVGYEKPHPEIFRLALQAANHPSDAWMVGDKDAELAGLRTRLSERARAGDTWAQGELTRVKERQRALAARRALALATLRREPELVEVGEIAFVAHALVVPSNDPEDRMRHDQEVEQVAVRVARAYEESFHARVRDVSTPPLARTAGLEDHPGFDLLSRRPDGPELKIEVNGRAGVGDVELKENEWAKACNLGGRYWLYVVYDCASAHPRLLRVQDPFRKLIVRANGGVLVGEQEVFANAEDETR